MPNGFWYAEGPARTLASIPASAYSKGDLLTFNSASSFSRINQLMPSGADIIGVAVGDSTQSISNLCTAIIPEGDTLFWASLSTAFGSDVTPGFECDIAFSTANNRYYVDPGSTSSVRVVIVHGTVGPNAVSQSVQSKVLVRLIDHAGNLEL